MKNKIPKNTIKIILAILFLLFFIYLEGRHFAVVATILIWIVGYLISFFYFSYNFSNGIIPKKLREKINQKKLTYLLIGTPFISPILAGLIYRFGGLSEYGKGIAWGCYIEDFSLGSILLWFLSTLSLFVLLLLSFVKPKIFGFQDRKRPLALYFAHHLYTLLLLLIIGLLIPILSGPLSGKESSCF
jgi:hypothetical protein